MTRDIETTVWCPKCRTNAFTVHRIPAVQEGVYENRIEWTGDSTIPIDTKTCGTCGGPLSRKEAPRNEP